MTEKNQTESKSFLRRAAKIVLPAILGAVCIYFILINFEWTAIWQTLQTIDVRLFLSSSIVSTLLFWLLRSVRWLIFLRGKPLEISFFKLYLYTAVTIGFANFTPFQSGEALKVELFRKHGGERFSGYNYFFLEKLLDLAVVAALAALGVFVLFEFKTGNRLQLLIAAFVAGLLVLAAAVVFILKKSARRGFGNAPDYKSLFRALAMTAASWTTMIFGWKYIFQSAWIDLTLPQTASVVSLTTIIGIISLVPGAIGVSEISIAAMLSQLGYTEVQAQTGAVMIALYSLVILILTIFHLAILKAVSFEENEK